MKDNLELLCPVITYITVCKWRSSYLFSIVLQKGKFGIFGHKRSKSETETDGFICPLDLALPLDKLKTSALLYQEKEVRYIRLL